MALRDVQNYKFLKDALRQKFLHIDDPNFTKYKGILYEPMDNPGSIFGRTYSAFRELIDKKGLDLKSYLNIGDKNVLERLYLNLGKDPNLNFLDKPELTQNDPKYELTEQYHEDAAKAEAVTQQAAGGSGAVSSTTQPGGVAADGGHGPTGLPPMAHVGTATMQSVQQGEAAKTMESPQEEAAAKTSVSETSTKAPPTPKPPQKTTAPPQKPPSVRPSFQAPKIPAGISSAFRNATSALGRSFYRNIGSRINLNSLVSGGFNLISGMGGSLGAMGGNPGIPSGGMFGSVRRIIPGRNGLGFMTRFGKTPGISKLKGLSTGGKVAWAVPLFGLMFFGVAIFSAISQPPTTGEASPQTPGFINTQAPPPSPEYQKLHADILDKYKLNFDTTFPYEYLKWAWEKLGNVSGTKFLQLVNPNNNVISVNRIADSSSLNEQTGCSGIGMRARSRSTGQPYPESLFKVVFIHELSHAIDSCNPNSNKAQLQQIINQEGYLTSYSQNAGVCAGSNNLNEDYAETIAYFLNPEFPEQSLGIGSVCEPASLTNPYSRNKPLHQQFASQLLTR